MKFCTRRMLEYKGINNITTSVHYIFLDDVKKFHGVEFANKWLEFVSSKPNLKIDNNLCYYYDDYKFAARQTDSFLNPSG